MTTHYGNFEFALLPPLVDQLVEFINRLQPAALNKPNLEVVANDQGVYLLYHKTNMVYIGKTDSESGLKGRLERHMANVAHRVGLRSEEVKFKAVRVAVFTALDLETALMSRQDLGSHEWNGSGFGANDPGKERDTTKAEAGHFDYDFPIDVDVPLENVIRGRVSVAKIIEDLRNRLPYTFRVARIRGRNLHQDFNNAEIILPDGELTVRSIIGLVVAVLPRGWQFTRLAGRLIAYKELKGTLDDKGEVSGGYPSAIEWWRSPGSLKPLHHLVRKV